MEKKINKVYFGRELLTRFNEDDEFTSKVMEHLVSHKILPSDNRLRGLTLLMDDSKFTQKLIQEKKAKLNKILRESKRR